jgi:hypothetical protein
MLYSGLHGLRMAEPSMQYNPEDDRFGSYIDERGHQIFFGVDVNTSEWSSWEWCPDTKEYWKHFKGMFMTGRTLWVVEHVRVDIDTSRGSTKAKHSDGSFGPRGP